MRTDRGTTRGGRLARRARGVCGGGVAVAALLGCRDGQAASRSAEAAPVTASPATAVPSPATAPASAPSVTPVAGTSPFVALPGSATTLDDLGATIVRALVASDTTRLAGVRLSEQEYHDLVWPKLPLSRMGSNYPFAFSWSDLQLRNGRALRRYLGRFRARALRGTATQCDGKREQYADVVIVHDCHVVVADERGGAESMQLFRSAVLLRGGYKIFRYDD